MGNHCRPYPPGSSGERETSKQQQLVAHMPTHLYLGRGGLPSHKLVHAVKARVQGTRHNTEPLGNAQLSVQSLGGSPFAIRQPEDAPEQGP